MEICRRSPAETQVEKDTVEKLVTQRAAAIEITIGCCELDCAEKDGSLLFAFDLRALNAQTVADSYPIEGFKENLDWLVRT